MSKKLYEEANIQDIASAIREKNGSQNTYTVSQMGNAVRAIHTDPVLEALSVTENGNYLPSAGKDGFSSVAVDVSSGGYPEPTGTIQITQNGAVNVKDYATANVNVSGGGSGTMPNVVNDIITDSYIAFSQKSANDLNTYICGLDTVKFDDSTSRSVLVNNIEYTFDDIRSLFDTETLTLEFYPNVSTDGGALQLRNDILSKLNAVHLGNIFGEGDLNDSIENYSRLLLFGAYSANYSASKFDVGIFYPAIEYGNVYITGMKDRNSSYRASVIFTSNDHVTAKSNMDGTGNNARVCIYGIP